MNSGINLANKFGHSFVRHVANITEHGQKLLPKQEAESTNKKRSADFVGRATAYRNACSLRRSCKLLASRRALAASLVEYQTSSSHCK